MARGRRPGSVQVLTVLVVLQALLLGVIAAVLIASSGTPEAVAEVEIEPGVLVATGVGLAVLAVAEFSFLFLLRRGSEVGRTWFAAFAVVQAAGGVYATVALRDFEPTVLAQLALSVLVLWLLYGSETTQAFFRS